MKLTLPIIIFTLLSVFIFAQDCTLEDASDCVCEDGSEACYLLPNINVSRDLLENSGSRREDSLQLKISVSTPNIGYGPLAIFPSNNIICGTDTIFDAPLLICPDGSQPRQLVRQRIYKKKEGQMEYEERDAGYMAYHPTHGHLHFNDWNNYTLRIEIPGQSNPLKWPIIGERTKMGFCLQDTHSCDFFEGYCRNEEGDTLLSNNIPNYGLGSGEYQGCNYAQQGISVGAIDIYYLTVDGMVISIPGGTCNGKYKLVVEADPGNQIVESNENDNIEVIDIELTKQTPPDVFLSQEVPVIGGEQVIHCDSSSVKLSVPGIGSHYRWSNGDTTRIANITEPGLYYCTIQTPCGEVVSEKAPVLAEVCETDCIDLKIGVWLEGSYNEEKNAMSTDLQKLQLLPGQQPPDITLATPPGNPYCVAPWNYYGVEGFGSTAGVYSPNVVDWVLVSLRDSIPSDTEILQTAALLLKDGSIEFPNKCALPAYLDIDSVYILIEHRNHIGVMTPNLVGISNKKFRYDFRENNSYHAGGSGQKQLNDSTWVMFAGDGYQLDSISYDINGADKVPWANNNGRFNIYASADYNLNGDVNGLDKAYWNNNNGVFSAVPK